MVSWPTYLVRFLGYIGRQDDAHFEEEETETARSSTLPNITFAKNEVWIQSQTFKLTLVKGWKGVLVMPALIVSQGGETKKKQTLQLSWSHKQSTLLGRRHCSVSGESRQVGRRTWGVLCLYPSTSSFSPPQYASTHCWVPWSGQGGMLGLERKILSPSAVLFVDRHVSSPTLWRLVFALGCWVPYCLVWGHEFGLSCPHLLIFRKTAFLLPVCCIVKILYQD